MNRKRRSSDQKNHGERLTQVETDVHYIRTKLEELMHDLRDNLHDLRPKPISIPGIIAAAGALVAMLGGLFMGVNYIASSSSAPLIAQNAQLASIIQDMRSDMSKNTSLIQLTNKEMASISSKATDNEGTLQYMLFEKNLPEQITRLDGRITSLEEKAHIHKSMAIK